MSNWKITVLYYGKITLPKGLATPGLDPDLILESPYLGFLLQNGARNILVDSGIADSFIVDGKAWGGFPAEGGRALVEKSLAGAGVSPGNIDTVIFTHLHNDHAANTDLFPQARLIFQKDEWRTLLDPLPIMQVRRDYDPGLIPELKKRNCLPVQGDFEPAPGLKCFKTPGHTPGCQSVLVNTEKGPRVIVGDHWHLSCMAFAWHEQIMDMQGGLHKITPPPQVHGRFIPSSLIYNYYDYYDSCHRILSMIPEDKPEYIVPGHEPGLIFTGV
jgi:glyoxylase-like metal-dependent hydrolase (beta-lactamase superfamily II)